MEQIILATNNAGKIQEIKEILKEFPVELISLKEAGITIDVEEDQSTFEGNALKKAEEITKLTGKSCIADDSGICINFLKGFPGVETKRFLGEQATQEERNQYLIQQLEKVSEREERKAQVVTCISLSTPNTPGKVFKGVVEGYISKTRRGSNGFGFDEIFELEDGRTLAELSKEEKNKISSRKQALQALQEFLRNQNERSK